MKVANLFLTIQGEAQFSGLLTVFIRTAFCPLRCQWPGGGCDTGFANKDWIEVKYDLSPAEIIGFIQQKGWKAEFICITGGEPLLDQEMLELVKLLDGKGFTVGIETSGVVKFSEFLPFACIVADIKCPSAGEVSTKNRYMDWRLLRRGADQLKAVVADRNDYEFVKERLERYQPKCEVLLSPVWVEGQGPLVSKDLARWMIEDQLQVRLQLQIHKIIGVE